MIVGDAALNISPYFELKGEYINTWWQTTDMGTLAPRGWWIQPAFKLALRIRTLISLSLTTLNWSAALIGWMTVWGQELNVKPPVTYTYY